MILIFVYKVMKDKIKYIGDNITEALSKVHYFSDGCAGQYKNCKNFFEFVFIIVLRSKV